jgi:hypothetical protein
MTKVKQVVMTTVIVVMVKTGDPDPTVSVKAGYARRSPTAADGTAKAMDESLGAETSVIEAGRLGAATVGNAKAATEAAAGSVIGRRGTDRRGAFVKDHPGTDRRVIRGGEDHPAEAEAAGRAVAAMLVCTIAPRSGISGIGITTSLTVRLSRSEA